MKLSLVLVLAFLALCFVPAHGQTDICTGTCMTMRHVSEPSVFQEQQDQIEKLTKAVSKLTDILKRQDAQIDDLQRQIRELGTRLRALQGDAAEAEKPAPVTSPSCFYDSQNVAHCN